MNIVTSTCMDVKFENVVPFNEEQWKPSVKSVVLSSAAKKCSCTHIGAYIHSFIHTFIHT
jgi:hypothetical protein